jgi:hypothetical protein
MRALRLFPTAEERAKTLFKRATALRSVRSERTRLENRHANFQLATLVRIFIRRRAPEHLCATKLPLISADARAKVVLDGIYLDNDVVCRAARVYVSSAHVSG